ncbi:MAG: hypothetical protein JWO67_2518, partial [Streptosporangiaceae bacterium]|nr:hypothetical protein [Streptosporangiaceae bacterium]
DLTAAAGAAPGGLRETLLSGAVAGLEAADRPTRTAVLTDAACDLLYARLPALYPRAAEPAQRSGPSRAVALHVLRSAGRRHPARRVEVTRLLIGLGAPAGQTEEVLGQVWAEVPTALECRMLLDALGHALTRYPYLHALPSRTFARLITAGGDLAAPETVALAVRAGEVLPGDGQAAADAAVVRACASAAAAGEPAEVLRSLEEIGAAAAEASGSLIEAALICAADRLALRDPVDRAAMLAAAREPLRERLVALWCAAGPSRAARNELVEVAIRLDRLGVPAPGLTEWAARLAARRLTYAQLDAHLREDRDLRAGLKELAAQGRRHRRGG